MCGEDFASRSIKFLSTLDGILCLEDFAMTLTHNLQMPLAIFFSGMDLIMHLARWPPRCDDA